MGLLQNLSDDQIVAIGSTVALACCVGLMYLSHALSRTENVHQQDQPRNSPATGQARAAGKSAMRRRDAA